MIDELLLLAWIGIQSRLRDLNSQHSLTRTSYTFSIASWKDTEVQHPHSGCVMIPQGHQRQWE